MGSYSSCIISRAVEKRINVVVLNVGAESRCFVSSGRLRSARRS
jgi:hypothetical protein